MHQTNPTCIRPGIVCHSAIPPFHTCDSTSRPLTGSGILNSRLRKSRVSGALKLTVGSSGIRFRSFEHHSFGELEAGTWRHLIQLDPDRNRLRCSASGRRRAVAFHEDAARIPAVGARCPKLDGWWGLDLGDVSHAMNGDSTGDTLWCHWTTTILGKIWGRRVIAAWSCSRMHRCLR